MTEKEKAEIFEIQSNAWTKIITRAWVLCVSTYLLIFSEGDQLPIILEVLKEIGK